MSVWFFTHTKSEREGDGESVCVCACMQSEGACARARAWRSIFCRAVRRRTVRGSSSLTSSLTSTLFETFLSNESFLYQRRRKKIEFPFEWDVRADVEAVLKWWYYILDILSDKITEKELCFVNLRQLQNKSMLLSNNGKFRSKSLKLGCDERFTHAFSTFWKCSKSHLLESF